MNEIRVSPSPHDPARWVWWESIQDARECGEFETLPATEAEAACARSILAANARGIAPSQALGLEMRALLAKRAAGHSGTPALVTRHSAQAVNAAGTPTPSAATAMATASLSQPGTLPSATVVPPNDKGAVGAAPLFVSPTSADRAVSNDGANAWKILRQKPTETFPR